MYCDAPRDNPLDPGNPESDVEALPSVTDISVTQIDRGFDLNWAKVDSTIPDIVGYYIYRTDHSTDSTKFSTSTDPKVNYFTDLSFTWPADSGQLFSYEIRAVHTSDLEGYPRESQAKRLIAIPIKIGIRIRGSIGGLPNADPKGYTDTADVIVEVDVKNGDPNAIMVSENASFVGASWEVFTDEYAFELSKPDGEKTIFARCKNLGGGESNDAQDSIILDTSPPKNLSVEIIPVNNPLYQDPAYQTEVSEFTPSPSVQLEISASDSAKWRAEINNESADFPPNPSSTNFTNEEVIIKDPWELLSQPGTRKVYARFEDELGHVEENEIPFDEILYDPLAPVAENCSILINDGQQVISTAPFVDVTLTISATDVGEAGIFLMRLGNSTTECTSAPWEYYADNKYWSLADLGAANGYVSRSVFVQFSDRAGNIGPTTPVSDNIWVNPPPESIKNFRAETSYEQVKLLWDASPENDVISGGVYIIEKAPAGQSYTTIDTLASSIVQYIDTDVQNGTLYSYNIWAVDSTGLEGNKASLSATPNNQQPSITGFIIAPDSVGRRETVFEFSATSDLVNDDHTPFADLKVQWKFKTGDAWSEMSTRKDTTHTYVNDTGNVYDVSQKVTDADGASTTYTRRVRINCPPNQATLTATPQREYKKKDITFTAEATDDDNDDLEYYFDFDDGTSSGWTPDFSLLYQYDPSGTYSAKVIVRDTWGDSSGWSLPFPVYIDNHIPDAPQNPVASPSPVYKNTDIIVSATLSDPDVDNVRLQAQWEKGTSEGTPVPSGTSGSVTLPGGYGSSDLKSLTLYTLDEEDAASSPTTFSIDVQNRAPNNPEFCTSLPTMGYTCEEVSFDARAYDPDGDQVQLTVQWGDGQSDTSPWLPSGQCYGFSHTYNSTSSKTISVTATDDEGASSGPTSRNISINQRPPDINNPANITITYPSSSGTTQIENVATSCAQPLTISSVNDNATWLTTSVYPSSMSPGQTATLTATVSSWSSFNYGDTKYASINISSNDPDEQSKTVSVSATKGYPVCNVFRMLAPSWEGADGVTNNPNGPGTWSWLPSAYGSDNGCGVEPASLTINDNDDDGTGYFRWEIRGEAPKGRIGFFIEGMTAEDHALFSSAVDWAYYFDGDPIYSSTLDESDGCSSFSKYVYGDFSNQVNHTFEIRVFDSNIGTEDISFNRVRIEWCGWTVGDSEQYCTGCN